MGRIRTIKPEFFKHGDLFDLEQETGLPVRLAFAGLWTCSDREGRFKWRPRELKIDVLPYDDCDFSRVLDALATRGFIVKYTCGTESFGYIPTWNEHQFINNKEPASGIPKPTPNQQVDVTVTRYPRVDDANGTRGVKEGKGKEGNGTGTEEPVSHPSSPRFDEDPPDEDLPEDVAPNVLCSRVGIFDMREMSGMALCFREFRRASKLSPAEAMRHMVGRWEEFQTASPKLDWQWGSAYKFFMSGKWDDPRSWPRGKEAKLEAGYAAILKG